MRGYALLALLFLVTPFACATSVSEFYAGGGTSPEGICVGPDGNFWYATNGGIATMSLAAISGGHPVVIYSQNLPISPRPINCVSLNGDLWAAEEVYESIAQFNPLAGPEGTYTTFPTNAGAAPCGACVGSDGNLWFCEHNLSQIGVCDLANSELITEIPIEPNCSPEYICTGPDGNLWFTQTGNNHIGTLNPVSALTTGTNISYVEYPCLSQPHGICSGPDGALWFTEEDANAVSRMTTAGVRTDTFLPTSGAGPQGICVGPDNQLWFCENAVSQVGVINLSQTLVSEYPTASANSGPTDICTGPDGNLWFTEYALDNIAVLYPASPPAGTTSSGTTAGTTTSTSYPAPVNANSGTSCGLGASGMGLLGVMLLTVVRMRRPRTAPAGATPA